MDIGHQWQDVMDNEFLEDKTDDEEDKKHFLEGKEGGR